MKTVYVKCGPNESTHVVIKGVVGAKTKFVKEVLITDLLPSEWISVEDGLPEMNKTVIAYEEECGLFPGELDEAGWFDLESQVFLPHHQVVAYWMPLPEPPKQQLNEKG